MNSLHKYTLNMNIDFFLIPNKLANIGYNFKNIKKHHKIYFTIQLKRTQFET